MEQLKQFFGVVIRGQTYLNALYLLLSFPLGIFYFVFLVTGLALGVGLLILWVGLLILLAVFATWYALGAFERQLAIWLLREDIPPMTREESSNKSLWDNFVAALKNPVTWKGLVYLFAKFPLGIVSFVVLVTLVSVSVALVAAPFYYQWIDHFGIFWSIRDNQPLWRIDTMGEALILSLIGLFITLISMHILNGLAWVSGKFAKVMLGNAGQPSALPPAPTANDAPPTPESPAMVG